ncbi:hypothetical protein BDR06DRAFT_110062 [Suillus hirtellus]|nr:hypothetical protein BDR06DRAFT_110062 [Suillus hirtellus]
MRGETLCATHSVPVCFVLSVAEGRPRNCVPYGQWHCLAYEVYIRAFDHVVSRHLVVLADYVHKLATMYAAGNGKSHSWRPFDRRQTHGMRLRCTLCTLDTTRRRYRRPFRVCFVVGSNLPRCVSENEERGIYFIGDAGATCQMLVQLSAWHCLFLSSQWY